MCNKQTLPTARGQETCAHRYSSLLPHTDNMPTSKVHTEQKGDGSEQHFAKAITVSVTERGCKCWKELSKMQSTTVKVHAHSDKVDLPIRFLKVIRVQGTVVASSIA